MKEATIRVYPLLSFDAPDLAEAFLECLNEWTESGQLPRNFCFVRDADSSVGVVPTLFTMSRAFARLWHNGEFSEMLLLCEVRAQFLVMSRSVLDN